MIGGVAWLFCPADRPDRFAKAASIADVVILDLEDGVAPQHRAAARQALADVALDPVRTVVRLNPSGTHDHSLDLAALSNTDYSTVMLAKSEAAGDAAALAPLRVVALCETPRGIVNAAAIASAANVDALMWGAEDLVSAIGGFASRRQDGRYLDFARHARATALLAAAAVNKPAIDAVHLNIADLDGLASETADAVASGFAAKACIHPSQVAVVHDEYLPDAERAARARRIVRAAEHERGVFQFEGQMVDEPVLRQARRTIERDEAVALRGEWNLTRRRC
jgi:citrate lyase subunit beta / citryl-CoA lyase